jgi:uncharacterized protein YutD
MGEQFGTATIKNRAYFSSHHLWAAEKFTKVCGEIENSLVGTQTFNIEHRAYVIATIVCAVAFLEAAINEVFQDAFDKHQSYVGNLNSNTLALMKDFWETTGETKNKSRTAILRKYQLALCFACVPKFEKNDSLYLDASKVVDLRNELVHYKPKSLVGDKCLDKGCADWCVKSSRNFADEFFKRIGIQPNYQRLKI